VIRLFLALLLLLSAAAFAQDKARPAGMSDEQYKSMVDDIADAVAKKLDGGKGGKKGDKTATAADEARPAAKSEPFDAIESMRRMRDQTGQFLARVPDYPGTVGEFRGALNFELDGETHRLGWMLQWLLITVVAGVAVEYAVRALLSRMRLRWRAATGTSWTRRFLANAALDAAGLAALIVFVYLASERWLPSGGPAADVGSKILTLFFIWRIFAVVLEIWFRPGDSECRVVAVDDADAKLLATALSLLILSYIVGDSWMYVQTMAGLPVSALEVAVLIDNFYSFVCDLTFIWFTRHAAARWLAALVEPGDGLFNRAKLMLANCWLAPALMFAVLMSVVQFYGSISGNVGVSLGISTTLQAILMILLLESATDLPRRLAPPAPAGTRRAPQVAELIADVALMFGRLAFLFFVIRIWSVEVLALFTQEEFSSIRRNNIATGLIILAAYAIWKIAAFAIDRAMGTAPTAIGPLNEDAVQAPGAASRVRTVLPLIRATIAVSVFVLLLLLVLSQLGVNITPLIAGASVLGLAISFGSQTLVKDIVSGIFYLVDDAFRVGDYIDTGRVKGTVEGFTLRSIKLRHQNGQVHTIPFGQLGAVTNFSRDWVTVKFNLRLARDVNLEQVRKTVKKIGQEMMADKDLGPEMLVQLKLQGVADIADNALVLRFKFTCKPTNPSIIQRQAIKRIYQTFKEKGIDFASSAITVQTAAGQADADPALAAAGAAAAAATAAAAAGKPPG
jgi:small-conductance mechanosensitive channel